MLPPDETADPMLCVIEAPTRETMADHGCTGNLELRSLQL